MNINYEIPADLHRELKIAAATDGVTLKEMILTLLSVGLTVRAANDEVFWESREIRE